MSMTRTASLGIVAAVLIACGGKGKRAPAAPDETGDSALDTGGRTDEPDGEGTMVMPEQADEIRNLLDRKRPAVSRCLGIAIDNKDLPKSSRGKITLGIEITPSGRPSSVKVLKATIESEPLTECVLKKVREIQFPQIPTTYETTYTYAFEAN